MTITIDLPPNLDEASIRGLEKEARKPWPFAYIGSKSYRMANSPSFSASGAARLTRYLAGTERSTNSPPTRSPIKHNHFHHTEALIAQVTADFEMAQRQRRGDVAEMRAVNCFDRASKQKD